MHGSTLLYFTLLDSINSATTKSITAKVICFKIRSGNINILERIRTHHRELGVLLLNDTTGAVCC